MNVDKQRNFFMMNTVRVITKLPLLILNVCAGRLSFSYFFLFYLVSTSVLVLLIFLLTPGFAPLAK
jgi:hypothetical protein